MVQYFITLLIMLVAAIVVGEIFKRIRQPALIGQILVGILIGPAFLSLVHSSDALDVVIQFIVFFMIFITGLELHPGEIKKGGKNGIFISVLAFVIPLVGVAITANSFGLGLIPSLFIGVSLAITAVPVVKVILMDFGISQSRAGTTVIATSVLDYILAMIMFGIVLQLGLSESHQLNFGTIGFSTIKVIAFVLGVFGIVLLLNRTRNWLPAKFSSVFIKIRSREAGIGILLISAFGPALIAQQIGLHYIIGAFFAGLIIYHEVIGKENYDRILGVFSAITLGFLAPIFFVFIGMQFDPQSVTSQLLPFVLLLGVAIIGKIGAGFIGAKIAGFSNSEGKVVGYLMNSRGIVELVILFVGFKAGIIDLTIFSIVVAISIIATSMTPLLIRSVTAKLPR